MAISYYKVLYVNYTYIKNIIHKKRIVNYLLAFSCQADFFLVQPESTTFLEKKN